jgi:FkbM family methyltransferase
MNFSENKNKIIIDVGLHDGKDTEYYLSRGFTVAAIEADVSFIKKAEKDFPNEINEGRLKLYHVAITEKDFDSITFHISSKSIWNSIDPNVSQRANNKVKSVTVPTRTLGSIVDELGKPYYIKIDIEGSDTIALNTLKNTTLRPDYLSVESECVREGKQLSESEVLETLHLLRDLGYKQFKMVDQTTFQVLPKNGGFYTNPKMQIQPKKKTFLNLAVGKIRATYEKAFNKHPDNMKYRYELLEKLNYFFKVSSSGPFGEDLAGVWLDFEEAKQCVLTNRAEYHALPSSLEFGFWCDWHAKI